MRSAPSWGSLGRHQIGLTVIVLHNYWYITAIGLELLLAVLAAGHAVLKKRDSRSAIAWVGFIWFVPLVGAIMYFVFGLNRIRRKATVLRRDLERHQAPAACPECPPEELQRHLPEHRGHLQMLARVVGAVVERPLLPGNRIDPLVNGEEAYPAMLEAIQHARQTVSLVTYIFDRDDVGRAFAQALGKAARRGVEVRVLIDAMGTRYSWPSILPTLRRERVPYARFLPSSALWRPMSLNMRTHRKIMVVDGCWVLLGSANWDPRSLRLNFEFNLECYDAELAGRLDQWIETKLSDAHPVTMEEVDGRSLPARLRDAIARLLTPYL
jgi:cardiolipin synthase